MLLNRLWKCQHHLFCSFSLKQRNHLVFCLSSVAREGKAQTCLPRRRRPYVVLTVLTTRLDRWEKREQKTKEQRLKVQDCRVHLLSWIVTSSKPHSSMQGPKCTPACTFSAVQGYSARIENESFEHQMFLPKCIAFPCDKGNRIFQTQTVGMWSSLVLNAFGLSWL